MQLDLVGRIGNISLAPYKGLLPLFEAVVNSFDAIESSPSKDSKFIRITILRDTIQMKLDLGNPPEIIGFKIEDNGVGFDDENFNSFSTSDTKFKRDKGGKGIGRLLWLKAFDHVSIKSNFQKNGNILQRSFSFKLCPEGVIGGNEVIESDETALITSVNLHGYKEIYRDKTPKKAGTIAFRIIEHCLSFFMREKCPSVFLNDGDESLSLNQIYTADYEKYASSIEFSITNQDFHLFGLRLTTGEEHEHRLHLCANSRDVISYVLSKRIPNLAKRLQESDGKQYVFAYYLTSKYLDDNVNPERTSFALPEEKTNDAFASISLTEIVDGAISAIKTALKDTLQPIQLKKRDKIENFIKSEAPQYRHLMKYIDSSIDEISPDISNDKLEIELYRINQQLEIEVKKDSVDFLKNDTQDPAKLPEYEERFAQFVEKATEVGKANLAKYIEHRKLILSLLDNSLKKRSDGKYPLEEHVHEIIFPRHQTSDTTPYEEQNLWIIDEKLSYHYFLASDVRICDMPNIASASEKRPDICIFNHPIAFVDERPPYDSIVIIEFKRPMRKDFSEDDENPFAQVYGYIRDIRAGNKSDIEGRPIDAPIGVPGYAYIICDLTKQIRALAQDHALLPTPDGMGFFGYNPNNQTYVEVISYDKLLGDALKRNRILFEKLGIA